LYNVLSQTLVELEDELPLPSLCHVTMAELNGQTFAIGGLYKVAPAFLMRSDHVFALVSESNRWVEQKARLIESRSHTPTVAATYQNKLWLAGGYATSDLSASIEVFDPLVGSWQAAGNLSLANCNTALIAINDDLFAATGKFNRTTIEKRDQETGAWKLVSELYDGNRSFCSWAACDSSIYLFGGGNATWNRFDIRTNTWASEQEQFRDEDMRQIPNGFRYGQAVCITPTEQIKGVSAWVFRHREEEELDGYDK